MPGLTPPEINARVVLRDDERAFLSRVEDVAPGVLTVARPHDLPVEHDYVPGAELLVTWSCPRGIAVLPTRLARYFAGLLPLQLFDLPFALGPFHLEIVSLDLRRRDQALQWLVERIREIGLE